MLELALHLPGPGPATPPVQTWPDKAGDARVRAFRVGDVYWLEWPGVGRFELTPERSTIRAMPCPGVDRTVVIDIFERFVVPLAWHVKGKEALHASALSQNGVSAIAFCAPSGTGKSTVACGLAMRGRTLLTDDGLLVDNGVPPPVRAVSTDVRLRSESSAHFGFPVQAGRHSLDLTDVKVARAATLGGIVMLDRGPRGTRAVAVPLRGGEALAAVVAHAHCLDPTDDARRARSVARYLDIVAEVPVWRLAYPTGFEELEATLDLVEQTVEGVW